MSEPRPAELLAEPSRRVHRALLEGLLGDGIAPGTDALAERSGVTVADLPARLQELAAADYAAFDAAGTLTCLYPLSPSPTPHVAVVDGRRRHAMCAIDLLGLPAMIGRELDLEGRCAVCEGRIFLRVQPGGITSADPATARVVARRDETAPAVTACCPFTVFACGPEHAQQLAARMPGSRVLPLALALVHAEAIFGDFLAPTLPANRPRGNRWEWPDDG